MVTSHFAVMLAPSSDMAVIVTLPALSGVTFPFSSTVAISSSEEYHFTVWTVASEGVTVTSRSRVSVTSIEAVVWLISIPVTFTGTRRVRL